MDNLADGNQTRYSERKEQLRVIDSENGNSAYLQTHAKAGSEPTGTDDKVLSVVLVLVLSSKRGQDRRPASPVAGNSFSLIPNSAGDLSRPIHQGTRKTIRNSLADVVRLLLAPEMG